MCRARRTERGGQRRESQSEAGGARWGWGATEELPISLLLSEAGPSLDDGKPGGPTGWASLHRE